MKRMFTLNSKSRSRWMLLLLFLLAGVTDTLAQNVTIRGNNGSTIAAVKDYGTGDTFFGAGGFATWQHEQLSMVLTVSDNTNLTPNKQLDNPANNLFVDGEHMQIAKGQADGANVCYVSLSLPKGYRFTGYTIKFSKTNVTKGSGDGAISFDSPVTSRFGETGEDFGTYTTQADVTNGGGSQTISRTGITEGNVLYFKLINTTTDNSGHYEGWGWNQEWVSDANNRALITLESAEIFFTAEENYSPVTPAGEIASPVSAVDIAFPTSKVDFGTIERRQGYGGSYRVSYSSANVTDLQGKFHLYEAESIEAGSGFDGVSGNVIKYQDGTISSEDGYFKLGREDKEQVYYLETPNYVKVSDGTKVPVGYRITGVQFEYNAKGSTPRTFYITYTYNGTKRYLGTNGRYTETRTIWEMDADGYISSNGYYIYYNNGRVGTQREKPGETERFGIDSDDNIYQLQWPTYYIRGNRAGKPGNRYFEALINPDNYTKADYEEITAAQEGGNFTLKVYDKEGKNPQTINVTGHGTYPLNGLNNDAVKFGVQGIGLVRATLTVQALDPYLDHMEVVCNDLDNDNIRMSQDFTASDFSVSGGEFYFFVPVDTKNVGISFENLSSKYFDETYTGGNATHTSRINFVQSLHNQAFGTTTNNIYTNTSEAADAKLERLKVDVVGSSKFTFNNADVVGASGGTYKEFPFTFAKYAEEGGSFGEMKYKVTEEDQVATKYVFTTDETRYNIAPTTAIQHRAYAYYEMIVHVQSAHYQPVVEFIEVYDKTLYRDKDNKVQTDAFYGVKVTAPYTQDGKTKQGYASTADIFNIIDAAVKGSTATGTVKGTRTVKDEETGEETTVEINIGSYSGKDIKLTSAKQILYLDFSQLAGIYQITTDQHQSMEDYSNTGAANCMIFLPKGSSAPNNNVAYMLESGDFMSANDIVLTDKQPFYSPYKILMLETDTIMYKRQVTIDQYGKVQNASLILPFVIEVDNGKHVNLDGTEFTLHSMQANDALTHKLDQNDYAYFPTLEEGVTATTANTPYLVQLTENSTEDNVSFVVSQKGTTIEPTTRMAADYTFTGASSTGIAITDTPDGQFTGTYTFTPVGSYSGQSVPKTQNIFYFANDEFVNSADYVAGSEIRVVPFRAYYNTSVTGNAKLMKFGIIFDEGEGNEATGISNVNSNPDLMVVPGNGSITFTSSIEQTVRVNSVSGVLVENAKLQAGETRTVSVPAGMYVINGVKIIVK